MQQQVSIPYKPLWNWSWSTSTQSTQPGRHSSPVSLQEYCPVEKSESESEQEQILVPYDFCNYWTPWGREGHKCQQSKGHPSEVEGNRLSTHKSTGVGASHCQARQESPFNQPSLASNARSSTEQQPLLFHLPSQTLTSQSRHLCSSLFSNNTRISSNHNNDFGIMMPSSYKSTSSRMGCIQPDWESNVLRRGNLVQEDGSIQEHIPEWKTTSVNAEDKVSRIDLSCIRIKSLTLLRICYLPAN